MTPAVLAEFVLNGLVLGALYVVMALGLSIIFGMIGIINFAHGALFTLGAYAAFQVKDALGFPVELVVSALMVRLLGVSLRPVLTFVFGLGTAFAAIAGVLSAPLAGVQPAMGVNVGTAAFVVVTIGGLGSFWGAILSGLLVGQVVSLSIYFQPRAAEASMYILMAVILLLRPRGLMGERWDQFA